MRRSGPSGQPVQSIGPRRTSAAMVSAHPAVTGGVVMNISVLKAWLTVTRADRGENGSDTGTELAWR